MWHPSIYDYITNNYECKDNFKNIYIIFVIFCFFMLYESSICKLKFSFCLAFLDGDVIPFLVGNDV